jgi:hypothetical protein
MTDAWNIAGLLRDLTARGQHPAVIIFSEDGAATWNSESVADKALRLARGLRAAGRRGRQGQPGGAVGAQLPGLDHRGPRRAYGGWGRGADR